MLITSSSSLLARKEFNHLCKKRQRRVYERSYSDRQTLVFPRSCALTTTFNMQYFQTDRAWAVLFTSCQGQQKVIIHDLLRETGAKTSRTSWITNRLQETSIFCRLLTVDMSFLYRFLYLVIIDVKITFATEFIKTLHKHIIVYEWMLNISN